MISLTKEQLKKILKEMGKKWNTVWIHENGTFQLVKEIKLKWSSKK